MMMISINKSNERYHIYGRIKMCQMNLNASKIKIKIKKFIIIYE